MYIPKLSWDKLTDNICMGLFLGSLFCSIDLNDLSYANSTLLWWVDFVISEIYYWYQTLKSERMIPPSLLFFCKIQSVQFSSVTQSCPTLCNPMDCNMPGLPVHHQLLEFIQTHVHRVSEAIQPSHPLSSTSPPAFNLSHHQSLFQWVSSLHEMAKVLEFQLSSLKASVSAEAEMNIQDWFHLGLTGWISLQFKGLSSIFSNTTVQKHQLFSAQLSL